MFNTPETTPCLINKSNSIGSVTLNESEANSNNITIKITDENTNPITHTPNMKVISQSHRRRLSVVNVDGKGIIDNEDERGLVKAVKETSLLEMCLGNSRRRRSSFSIGSTTDGDLHRRSSFADKSITGVGMNVEMFRKTIGFACKKGLKPVSPNQDSFLVLHAEGGSSLYGVFDGHGRRGHDVSNIAKDSLPKLLVNHPLFHSNTSEALKDAFISTHQILVDETRKGFCGQVDASASGSTGTLVLVRGDYIWASHVGDSRSVLGVRRSDGSVFAVPLTVDHKPEIPAERVRIEASGGIVIRPVMDLNHRVYVKGQRYPGLAMSRALGDIIGNVEAGISCCPDVSKFKIQTNLAKKTSTDSLDGDINTKKINEVDNEESVNEIIGGIGEILIVCSDGVWEFISSQEAISIVSTVLNETNDAMMAAEELSKISWSRWIAEEGGQVVDDITVLVIRLNIPISSFAPTVTHRSIDLKFN